MGIKDEIAFLSCTSKSLGTYNDAIDDVLSILDEWECVEERSFRLEGEIVFGHGLSFTYLASVESGDHITILRRKKNESGS